MHRHQLSTTWQRSPKGIFSTPKAFRPALKLLVLTFDWHSVGSNSVGSRPTAWSLTPPATQLVQPRLCVMAASMKAFLVLPVLALLSASLQGCEQVADCTPCFAAGDSCTDLEEWSKCMKDNECCGDIVGEAGVVSNGKFAIDQMITAFQCDWANPCGGPSGQESGGPSQEGLDACLTECPLVNDDNCTYVPEWTQCIADNDCCGQFQGEINFDEVAQYCNFTNPCWSWSEILTSVPSFLPRVAPISG